MTRNGTDSSRRQPKQPIVVDLIRMRAYRREQAPGSWSWGPFYVEWSHGLLVWIGRLRFKVDLRVCPRGGCASSAGSDSRAARACTPQNYHLIMNSAWGAALTTNQPKGEIA